MIRFDFSGKTVIITGGNGDIGKAAAAQFLEAGANVVISGRNIEKGKAVLETLKEIAPDRVEFIAGDISCYEDDCLLVEKTAERFGGLDILVNNAGINGQLPERRPFHEYDKDFWTKVINIDLNGTFYLSQIASNLMIKQGRGGRIVNISSVMGVTPARLQCAFTAAKAGVIMLSRVMALELAPYNINVNCLCPGSILTEKTSAKFYSNKEKSEALLSHVPMKRPGKPDEIASGILFLASEEASYTTGDNMIIDGGWMCGYSRDW